MPARRERTVVALVGGLLFVIGVLFAGVGLAVWTSETGAARRLAEEGERADGEVARKWIRSDGGGDVAYEVSYRFTPPGGLERTGAAEVEAEIWDRLKPGGPVGVTYLPSAPEGHRLDGQVHDQLFAPIFGGIGALFALIGGGIFAALRDPPKVQRKRRRVGAVASALTGFIGHYPLAIFGVVWLLIGLPFVISGLVELRAQRAEDRRFAQEGERAEAVVLDKAIETRSRSGSGSRGRTTYHRVTFRYAASSGDEIVGTAKVDADTWERLAEGGPIAVTYVPDTPWRFRLEGSSDGGIDVFLLLGFGLLACAIGVSVPFAPRLLAPRKEGANQARRDGAPAARNGRSRRELLRRNVTAVAGLQRGRVGSRRIRLPLPRRWIMPVVSAVFLLGGSLALGGGVKDLLRERQYAQHGILAEARVTGKSIEAAQRTERSSTRHLLHYRFVASDETVEGRHAVPFETWEALKEGDRLGVHYLQSDPAVNRPADASAWADAIVGIVLGLVFGGVGGGLLAFMYLRARRNARLLRDGAAAPATVSAVEPSGLRINRVRQMQIRFRFRDAAGREHEGRSHPIPPDEAHAWIAGDVGEVRYDPERPNRYLWVGTSAGADARRS